MSEQVSCGFRFWSSGGSRCKNSKTPSRWDFLKIVLKVDLQISPSLRGLFTKKLQVLIFLSLFIFKKNYFVKVKWIFFLCISFLKRFLIVNLIWLIEIDFFDVDFYRDFLYKIKGNFSIVDFLCLLLIFKEISFIKFICTWDGRVGRTIQQKGPLISFILKYIKHYPHRYLFFHKMEVDFFFGENDGKALSSWQNFFIKLKRIKCFR